MGSLFFGNIISANQRGSMGSLFFGNIKSANQRGILGSLFSVTSNKRISEASLGIYFCVSIKSANQRGIMGYLFLLKHQISESARHHGVSFFSVTSYQRISEASWGLFFFGNIISANQRGIIGYLFLRKHQISESARHHWHYFVEKLFCQWISNGAMPFSIWYCPPVLFSSLCITIL